MINRARLQNYAADFGVTLDETALARMDTYAERLVQTNEHVNLTAITEPEDMLIKHFLDSLTVLTVCDPQSDDAWIDVGTGAGFPGAVLLMAQPDLKITFLDGTKKKLQFISDTLEALDLHGKIVHARAEEAGQNLDFRERFDFASARAVANLRELTEYCLPFLRIGGTFIAMKSVKSDEELREADSAIWLLGGKTEHTKVLTLPNGETRTLIVIKKISHTPTKYPRPSAKIAKQPLR